MSQHPIGRQTVVTDNIAYAAAELRLGKLIAFPTETVFGLGADALNPTAVQSIFSAKGRPSNNPLIVHVASARQIDDLAKHIPAYARELSDAFFPGPLTLVLPKRDHIPDATTAGLETVAVRMPDHEIALSFIAESNRFVAAPSANRSGRPSPTTWEAVFSDLNGFIDIILKGDQSRVGLESTVVDCSTSHPVVLRPGSISLEDLQLVIPSAAYSTEAALLARSPGTRHKHYQPEADVRLVGHPSEIPVGESKTAAFIGISEGAITDLKLVAENATEYAHHLFSFFRLCESRGVKTIYCETIPKDGIGWALMDRLERAASDLFPTK